MKRIISFTLALLISLGATMFVGCGDSADLGESTVYKYNFRGYDGDTMPIGGFIGPAPEYQAEGYTISTTITDNVYKKIADCGVNFIIDQRNDYFETPEVVKQMLTLSKTHGVNYFVKDTSAVNFDNNQEYVAEKEAFKNSLQKLYEYENFLGLYVRDEPTIELFSTVKKAIDNIKEVKQELGYDDLCYYVNMNNQYGNLSSDKTNKVQWQDYIDGFGNMGVDYYMFDIYPIAGLEGTVGAYWFNALGQMNDSAKSKGVPWLGYAQAGGSYGFLGNRVVNEYELCWNVNTMLAFGAKGIAYYFLCMPPEYSLNVPEDRINEIGLINKYGATTPIYYYAQKINKNIQAMDYILMNASHEGVIINGESPCLYTGETLTSFGKLKSVSGDSALVGCFNYKGQTALFVVNNSLTDHRGEITLSFNGKHTHQVIQRAISAEITESKFTLHLEAGESALVLVK